MKVIFIESGKHLMCQFLINKETGEEKEIHNHFPDYSGDLMLSLDMPENWKEMKYDEVFRVKDRDYIFKGTNYGTPRVKSVPKTA